jgi:hypothetical protein
LKACYETSFQRDGCNSASGAFSFILLLLRRTAA